ncbi:MAG: hypothetical protein RL701_2811 [Pseudomonadota bacterium]
MEQTQEQKQGLLAEFPSVTYEAWRSQVERDLKGADFDKRLLTRTLEGIVVQPLYTARDVSDLPTASSARSVLGLPAFAAASQYDLRVEQNQTDLTAAALEIAEDLAGGATSLWLRSDAFARLGDASAQAADGLPLVSLASFAQLLAGVDLARVAVALEVGGNVAVAALFLAHVEQAGIDKRALRGTLGCDPLGALARDGALPWSIERARTLFGELTRYGAEQHSQLRAAEVATDAYHLAGANSAQELAYAFATGAEYLRWSLAAGLDIEQASAQLSFRVAVASDLFVELAKLRALRLGWAKIIAAHGGGVAAQHTQLHAVTSLRTKTRRDPWVNMLRTTTETFAALVGGADAVTPRAFDAALGRSDGFARRIARNVQIILSEEAHVTQVADAAGGSYYVESLTDQLARMAWAQFQGIEQRGGMSAALLSGAVAQEIEASAKARAQAVAKRLAPITGVSEFAHLGEAPVRRELVKQAARAGANKVSPTVSQLTAAAPGAQLVPTIAAARQGAEILPLTAALATGTEAARTTALPAHPTAEAFEALRDRADHHATTTGQAPRAFLCNLGPIPKHKARSSFATGLLNAGGIAVLDNEGFNSPEAAVAAFKAANTDTVVICGSDDQYPEWVPQLAPALRQQGARQIIVAGRAQGDQQASFEQAGVSTFIFVGVDVVSTLGQLLDAMGVAP